MVWEFTSTRIWRRRYVSLRMESERDYCRRKAVKERGVLDVEELKKCIEEAEAKVREEARALRWYETKLNFIAPRTLRIFDYATGYFVICWLARRRERPRARPAAVCMKWDPATFQFRGVAHSVHPCMTAIFDACYRSDATRNLHLETESCGVVVIRGLGYRLRLRDIRELVALLADASADAVGGVDECLDMFDLVGDPRVEEYRGYSTEYSDACFYCRCREEPGKPARMFSCRVCNKAAGYCTPTEAKPEVTVYE